jgi:hypothetical protein
MLKDPIRFIQEMYWNHQSEKYRKILLKEGILEAGRRKLNLQLGIEAKFINVDNEDPLESLYLPQVEKGRIDITELVVLGAEAQPDLGEKWIYYENKLNPQENPQEE